MKRPIPSRSSATLCAVLASAFASLATSPASSPSGDDELEPVTDNGIWPQWRGPARDGAAGGAPWPASLSEEHLREAWRVEDLGPSYSGPIVDAERVYTTETVDEEREVVRAFDRNTGKELWQVSWEGAMEVPFFAARNGSWIRSTPAVDEDALYVAGIRDMLKCLDAATGEERWSIDFATRFETDPPPFGCVCSPLVRGDDLFIQAGASLSKIDKRTGKIHWRVMIEDSDIMSRGSFSSPILAEVSGQEQLIAQSRTELAGLDPTDGSVLWSTPIKSFRGMAILTPTVYEDSIFTSAYGGRSHLFAVHASEDGASVEEQWNVAEQAYMSSPVVIDGHAYLFLKSNRFACLDLATGEERWTSGPTRDSYWSLAFQDERILALSDTGTLRLIEATPEEYRVTSEVDLTSDETWAHVAPVGEQIFVREQETLVAYHWK